MPRLVVRLLGGFRVELDGELVYGFETDKARALLAYLIVEADRPHRRETLAALLWPERPDSIARNSLRQALYRVRQSLGDSAATRHGAAPFLFVTATDVQFNAAGDFSLDVAALEALARDDRAAGRPARSDRPVQLLPEAFCGDFLAGFSVPESEAFQAWVLNRQEHYHRLTIEILSGQNAAYESAGDYEGAVAAARLQLQLEPWLEEAHRRCIRGLALAGRRVEALRQYEACCRALRAELDVEPAASTRELHAQIRDGRLVPPAPGTPRLPHGGPLPLPPPEPDRFAPLSVLVAREDELGRLGGHLQAALGGEPTVAFVGGDPGSGKTCLLEAFAVSAMAEHPGLLVAGARCSPGGHLDPLAPLRRLAEMLFGDLADELAWRLPGPEQADRLRRSTGLALAALAESGPDLAGTLIPAASIARRRGGEPPTSNAPTAAPRPDLAADGPHSHGGASTGKVLSQGALFDQLTRTLAAIARERPLLLLFDDLQWVDDATATFVSHVSHGLHHRHPAPHAAAGCGILILGAYRSTAVSQGRRDPASGEVACHPLVNAINSLRRADGEIVIELDQADGRAFIEAYVDAEPNRLGAPFRDALYAQTNGHALFTVELLRNLKQRGAIHKDEAGRWVAAGSLDWGKLPVRVEGAIAERVDHLSEAERAILSAACVQGDDFSGEIAAELTGMPVAVVLATLSGSLARQHHLVRPEGLQRTGGARRSMYRFAHHLFQKYLYSQLDPVERAQMHAAVADSLDRQIGADRAERERLAARLAWHYEAGGLPLQAARALHDAGHQAMRVAAYREALARFDQGLALLADEPPAAERTEIRRLLEVARLGPERNLEGIGSAGVQSALARAAEAGGVKAPGGEALGRLQLTMLSAEAEQLFARGDMQTGLRLAEELRRQAAEVGEELFVILGHWHFGSMLMIALDPQVSESHFDRILGWLTPQRSTEVRAAIGFDLGPAALAFSALNQWLLGHWDKALARSSQAVAAAGEQGDAHGHRDGDSDVCPGAVPPSERATDPGGADGAVPAALPAGRL